MSHGRGFRTMDWLQYISRFSGDIFANNFTFANICRNQFDFHNCEGPLISLSDVKHFTQPKGSVDAVFPLYPPSKMSCYTHEGMSFEKLILFFVGYFNDRARWDDEWGQYHKLEHPCTTGCCLASHIAQSLVYARYMCAEGVYLCNIGFYSFLVYLALMFFSPSLSAIPFFWYMGFSHITMLTFRTIGFKAYVPDPYQNPLPEVFLTDGGHIDNSGAFPLLRRKCGCIVAVDSDLTRDCSSIYMLMELSRRKLDCSWGVTPGANTVDPEDMLLDFRLPRARYVGDGDHPADAFEIICRERKARSLMLGEDYADDFSFWDLSALRQHVSHVRSYEGHTYLYFMHDEACRKVFLMYPFIREHFRIAQSIASDTGLLPEDYLNTEVMRKETLRHSAHFVVRYNNGSTGDFFYLRGEHSPEDLQAVRSYLKEYEPSGQLWTTIGSYPGHDTLGEGYTWAHVDAYAQFSKTSMEHAWNHGLRDIISHLIAALNK